MREASAEAFRECDRGSGGDGVGVWSGRVGWCGVPSMVWCYGVA